MRRCAPDCAATDDRVGEMCGEKWLRTAGRFQQLEFRKGVNAFADRLLPVQQALLVVKRLPAWPARDRLRFARRKRDRFADLGDELAVVAMRALGDCAQPWVIDNGAQQWCYPVDE